MNSGKPSGQAGDGALTAHAKREIDALCAEFKSCLVADGIAPLDSFLARAEETGREQLLQMLATISVEHLRREGVKDPAERVISANPALAAELQQVLNNEASTSPRFPGHEATARARGLNVRCPNCGNPIELIPDAELESILCPACGSDFSLVAAGLATKSADAVTQVGHFKLVERVGVGAFGSVWKAHDSRLDRTVAVKIPRKGQFDEVQEKAFLREAQNAARLNHPYIVPVYEVGREGDTLYIVSEFVRGLTLADWLTGQRPTLRESAELGSKLAEALHHAHERGVIHRDFKPGNVMLDRDGAPRLMDFGLARREAGEITITIDGQVLGTPAYMSPEQARGDAHAADRRSDVYSLGVTLFQLLTGELPFRGNARMLLHQVINEEPPSPRKLHGAVPRDLETITLKCLEKSPDKRYATALELRDDLQRWLRGEPIKARPIGRLARVIRWSSRNYVLAATGALAILAIVVGTAASLYFAIKATERAKEADSQRGQAVAALQKARQAVDDSFTMVSESQLVNAPGLQPLRRELLEAAAQYYENLAQDQIHDPTLKRDVALSYLRLSRMKLELGDATAATEHSRQAQQIWEAIYRDDAADRDARLFVAHSAISLGQCKYQIGDWQGAESDYLHAIDLLTPNLREQPHSADCLAMLMTTHHSLGMLQETSERLELAEQTLLKAAKYQEQLEQEFDAAPGVNIWSKIFIDLGDVQRALGHMTDAKQSYERAVNVAKQLVKIEPDAFGTQHFLALSLQAMGLQQHLMGNNANGDRFSAASLEIFEKLARENPQVPDAQMFYERSHAQVAKMRLLLGRNEDAERHLLAAVEVGERILQMKLTSPSIGGRQPLPVLYRELADLQSSMDHLSEAKASVARALEIVATTQNPEIKAQVTPEFVLSSLGLLATLAARTGDVKKAEEALRSVDDVVKAASQADPNGEAGLLARAEADRQRASVLRILGQTTNSTESYERSLDLYKSLGRSGRFEEEAQQGLADAWADFAAHLGAAGEWKNAAGSLTHAVERDPSDVYAHYYRNAALLAGGEELSYRSACRAMLSQFGASTDQNVADRVAYSCVATSDSIDDWSALVDVAKRCATRWNGNDRIVGAALCRAGRYAQALEQFNISQNRGFAPKAWDHAFLAIVHHHLGNQVEAREYVERANQGKETIEDWWESAEVNHLCQEAVELVGP